MQKKLFLFLILTTVCSTNIFAMNQKAQPQTISPKELCSNLNLVLSEIEFFHNLAKKLFNEEFSYYEEFEDLVIQNHWFCTFFKLTETKTLKKTTDNSLKDARQILSEITNIYNDFSTMRESYMEKEDKPYNQQKTTKFDFVESSGLNPPEAEKRI